MLTCERSALSRTPISLFRTAFKTEAVGTSPFIITSARPSLASLTARRHASSSLDSSIMVKRSTSTPASLPADTIACLRPINTASAISISVALLTAKRTFLSFAAATATHPRGPFANESNMSEKETILSLTLAKSHETLIQVHFTENTGYGQYWHTS